MSARPHARLVVFDLDGTITRRDTLVPFLLGWLARKPGRVVFLPLVAVAAARFCFDRDRGRLKSSLIRSILGRASRDELRDYAERFADRLLPSGCLAPALEEIRKQRETGAHMVLLSASPDLYVPIIAERLGFGHCICTQVSWRGELLEGRLLSANRRGEEKARVVRELLEAHADCASWAYGNSRSDLPHLLLVDNAFAINLRGALPPTVKYLRWF
ncbi:MAG: HAD-IB family hydrolase [Steroidobacteraceae bacterium]